MSKAPYRFMLRALIAGSPFLVFVLAAELFLYLSGETVLLSTIAERHPRSGPPASYMTMLISQQFDRLHFERIRRERPEILVLGSSHVTRFRKEMFAPRTDFYNCGRTIACVGDLEEFVQALPDGYAPKSVLLGIDHWWFNTSYSEPATFAEGIKTEESMEPNAHFYAFKKLLQTLIHGRFEADVYKRIFSRQHDGLRRYGVLAWHSSGIRNDGSNQVYNRTTPPEFVDKLPQTLEEIGLRPEPCFIQGMKVDEALLTRFLKAIKALEQRGTLVVCFLTPLSSGLRDLYSQYSTQFGIWFDYTKRVPETLEENGVRCIDGSNPAVFGLDDRCLIDRDHARETYGVALLREAAKNPQLRATLHLDLEQLESLLSDPRTTPLFPYFPSSDSSSPQ